MKTRETTYSLKWNLRTSGGHQADQNIGEHFIHVENPLAVSLPEGHIWAGSEGDRFPTELIKRALMPGLERLHNSSAPSGRDPPTIRLSPVEQFLSASYILDFMARHIRHEMNSQARSIPNIQVKWISSWFSYLQIFKACFLKRSNGSLFCCSILKLSKFYDSIWSQIERVSKLQGSPVAANDSKWHGNELYHKQRFAIFRILFWKKSLRCTLQVKIV